MNISYKAGLLTASFGRMVGRLTGNVISDFNRGLTTKKEPLPVDHHLVEEGEIDRELIHELADQTELAQKLEQDGIDLVREHDDLVKEHEELKARIEQLEAR
jgi:hypothetical protein